MSPVFRHGRLRLYLLKLLDDAPKHGYEVIRLLQDRFMGVYAPSPGTIYPRLARLEEEGLVTHDEVDGRKVYRLTDAGREEIRERMDDLAELEEEISESVRDIAREVKEDVRETVRSLREEIARAARNAGQDHSPRGSSRAEWEEALREDAGTGGEESGAQDKTETGAGAQFRGRRGRPKRDWGDWSGWRDWRERTGSRDWPAWDKPAAWPDPARFRDLERLALQFAADLRRVAGQAGAIGEDALTDLRAILDEALSRIRTEIFVPGPDAGAREHADENPPDDEPG